MSSESEEIFQFMPRDLPFLPVNSDCDSSDASDLEESTAFSTPSSPATPSSLSTTSTPVTPLSQLASSVTSFGFSHPEVTIFSVPSPKRYTKKMKGFQKGNTHHKWRLFPLDSPPSQKHSLTLRIRGNLGYPQDLVP